jgi:uroporphyrin-3 C-methyltransferase
LWLRYGPPLPVDPLALVDSAMPPVPAAEAEVKTLRRTLDDAARVNRALREQVLGLTQRVGLIEDGLAGIERGAAPGVDAVRMAEADFLLRLGDERLRLFSDVTGARDAFALADGQLSEVSDPRVTSVRQTLALERDALAAVAVADLPLILARLDRLADVVGDLPLRGREDRSDAAAPTTQPGWWKRLTAAIDRYFRVRRIDPAERGGAGPLLRERIALDLSRTRLLLLRAQGGPAKATLDALRTLLAKEFDESDERVVAALGVLDDVRSAPLVPQWPQLGESRRELARLRGAPTPASASPPAVDPAASGSADIGAPLDAELAEDIAAPDALIAAPGPPDDSPIDRVGDDTAEDDAGADPTTPLPDDR